MMYNLPNTANTMPDTVDSITILNLNFRTASLPLQGRVSKNLVKLKVIFKGMTKSRRKNQTYF